MSVRKVLLGLLALMLIGGSALTITYFRLTAPVNVARTPPRAATLPPSEEAPEDVAATATSPTAASEATPSFAASATVVASPPALRATGTTAASPTAEPTVVARAAARITLYRIDPEQSSATYSVQETFLEDARVTTAEGTTNAVAGEVRVNAGDFGRSQVGEIVVDISQLESDEPRRDNAIRRRWLESAKYPEATFANAVISGGPNSVTPGQPFMFQMTGNMTIREATRKHTWNVTATIEDNVLRGEATTKLRMSDYGVDPPNIGGFVAVEDELTLTLNIVAQAVR